MNWRDNDQTMEMPEGAKAALERLAPVMRRSEPRPMPTEWGVYVPATAALEAGPNVYVLYGDCWRMSPDIGNADEHARNAHERWGLTRLVRQASSGSAT